MTHILLREQAIKLRRQGKTYREIKLKLNIPKSTLSGWLQKYPLNKAELKLLKSSINKSRLLSIEKTIITKQKKRQTRLDNTYKEQKNTLLPLSKRELLIAGMFLYWGEGDKTLKGYIGISNTNPNVIKFSLYWLNNLLMVPKEKICVRLHLYNDMNINEEINFWSKQLKLPKIQFAKPYIKVSTRSELTYKGFGHGTCNLIVNNRLLKEKIIMGIEAIADFYCPRI